MCTKSKPCDVVYANSSVMSVSSSGEGWPEKHQKTSECLRYECRSNRLTTKFRPQASVLEDSDCKEAVGVRSKECTKATRGRNELIKEWTATMPTREVSGRIGPNDVQTKRASCKERGSLVEGVGCCSLKCRRWRARANKHPETDAK